MVFLKKKRILISGGKGFLGSFVVARLKKLKCTRLFAPSHKDYDLTNIGAVRRLYKEIKPDVVIHLAAQSGGIGLNMAKPGTLFYENLIMGANIMEEGRKAGVEKFVAIGTICAYPAHTPTPFMEDSLWSGYPEKTNAAYGLAKKMLLVQSQAYRQQYGFNSIFLMPANLYGPGDDVRQESSHVIPALIKKCCDAVKRGAKELVVWGTGNATREFLYVEDCAEAIVLALERYDKPDPVNLGTGREISIRDLSGLICRLSGFRGKVVWDISKPDGQMRRLLDVSRARKEFGFTAKTDFLAGLKKTIAWYRKVYGAA